MAPRRWLGPRLRTIRARSCRRTSTALRRQQTQRRRRPGCFARHPIDRRIDRRWVQTRDGPWFRLPREYRFPAPRDLARRKTAEGVAIKHRTPHRAWHTVRRSAEGRGDTVALNILLSARRSKSTLATKLPLRSCPWARCRPPACPSSLAPPAIRKKGCRARGPPHPPRRCDRSAGVRHRGQA